MTGVDEVVDHIEDAVRHGIEAQLRADGGVMPQTVCILAEDLEQPLHRSAVLPPLLPRR